MAKTDPESRPGKNPSTKPGKGVEQGGGTFSRDAKVADIRTGSKGLAEAKDYSEGYPDTMQHHINRGRGK